MNSAQKVKRKSDTIIAIPARLELPTCDLGKLPSTYLTMFEIASKAYLFSRTNTQWVIGLCVPYPFENCRMQGQHGIYWHYIVLSQIGGVDTKKKLNPPAYQIPSASIVRKASAARYVSGRFIPES